MLAEGLRVMDGGAEGEVKPYLRRLMRTLDGFPRQMLDGFYLELRAA